MTAAPFRSIIYRAERRFDRARFWARRKTGRLGTPVILPYRGFAVEGGLWMRGRVIEDQGRRAAGSDESLLTNLKLTWKRYESDEVRGATLEYAFEDGNGQTVGGRLVTDDEGYFEARIECDLSDALAPWLTVRLTLVDAPDYQIRPLGAELLVRVVSTKARYAVISDIDDTIVHTGATNFLKHWRTVVANSAESRTAFPGVSHFYRGLARGENGAETNPIHYVSSSPWNLFDLFERFMILREIPVGAMLLKDYGLDADKWLTGGHDAHKLKMIERLLEAHPRLPVLLIGDSGQRDAAIYAEIARRHRDRVLAVHIRDVTKGVFSSGVNQGLVALRDSGVAVTVAPTLTSAAAQAAERGWVSQAVAASVDEAIAARKNGEPEPPHGIQTT